MKKSLKLTKKILIVQAVFYEDISKMLLDGAIKEINKNNLDYDIITVSGALEIPIAIAITINKNNYYDGYIALGCVIRGETSHYDTVCNESARGLMDIGIKNKIPIANGIITVENEEQALERANPKKLNKGGYAVKACIKLIQLN
ncbi:MAG: 6,7-dimethyl-8-ribityllumazine synthase [Proteobacteria bacterium]|nr:6,7-dimethyl-8-ribityllumazine synthase [Pseudomonadota bacterium]NCA28096.1 6,7-dimethyl-8-ribityllumazine synthase [Pseudomonadota bacterium]